MDLLHEEIHVAAEAVRQALVAAKYQSMEI